MEQTKYPGDGKYIRLSKRLECVGKDMEFLFGSVNSRSRLLKLSLPLRIKDDNDDNFFMNGFFHNSTLHSFHGLDELAKNINVSRLNGFYAPWVANPVLAVASDGLQDAYIDDVRVEMEATHNELWLWVMVAFTCPTKHEDIFDSVDSRRPRWRRQRHKCEPCWWRDNPQAFRLCARYPSCFSLLSGCAE